MKTKKVTFNRPHSIPGVGQKRDTDVPAEVVGPWLKFGTTLIWGGHVESVEIEEANEPVRAGAMADVASRKAEAAPANRIGKV